MFVSASTSILSFIIHFFWLLDMGEQLIEKLVAFLLSMLLKLKIIKSLKKVSILFGLSKIIAIFVMSERDNNNQI